MFSFDRDDVLAAFRAHGGRPLKAKDVANYLGAPLDSRSDVRALIRVLADEGDVKALGGGRYVLGAAKDTYEGNVRLSRKGYGWFSPTAPDMPDAFVPPPETRLLMDGDTVEATIEPSPKGNVARIKRVLTRSRTVVVGRFIKPPGARFGEVDVGSSVMRQRVLIDQEQSLPKSEDGTDHPAEDVNVNYSDGDVVEVQMLRYPTTARAPMGRIIRRIGRAGQLDVEIERILEEHQIIRGFSKEALEQSQTLGDEPSEADMAGRDDLRKLALCTIDGQTAKDFDDAVYGECKGDIATAPINVVVTIADVAHYVPEHTSLDEDARERGTSLYYPSRVVPMLPEAISNGLCSLKPHVNRLCMSVKFTIDRNGAISKPSFSNAVMYSHARITYEAAWNFLNTGSLNTGVGDNIPGNVQKSLHVLYAASKRLRKARNERGALDFDLPEPIFDTDDNGHPEKVIQHERNDAHRLIEELMIAANETVATHFFKKELPSIFRVHEPPDPEKLERFMTLAKMAAKELGVKAQRSEAPNAKSLAKLTSAFDGSPLRQALDSLLLRAMMQAKYSAENVGHFSLASDAYLHFTSPIRRYPDLAVHREMKKFLERESRRGKRGKGRSKEEDFIALERISQEMSDLERKAMDCERAIMALYAVWYLRGFLGEKFDGIVTGVVDQGAYIRLDPMGLSAFLPIARISRDYLVRDEIRMRLTAERSGFSIGAGDKVEITLTDVDFEGRQTFCDLEVITEKMGKEVHIIPSKREEQGYFDKRFGKPGERKREYFKYGKKDEGGGRDGERGGGRRSRKSSGKGGGSGSPKRSGGGKSHRKGGGKAEDSRRGGGPSSDEGRSGSRRKKRGSSSSTAPNKGKSKAKPSKRRKPKNKR